MGLLNALAALAAEWDDVQSRLEAGQASRLRELTAQFVDEPDPRASSVIAENIMDLLLEGLPVTHPVLRALMDSEDRFRDPRGAASDLAWSQLTGRLRARLGIPETPAGSWGGNSAGYPGEISRSGPPGTTFGDDDDDVPGSS